MKLAFCLFKYFPYGGLQRDFFRIAQACQQRGHTIDVYTMSWEGGRIPDWNLHLVPVRAWQNHTRCRRFAEEVAKQLVAQSYDLVIGFNKMPHLDLYYAADVCYEERVRNWHTGWYRLLPRYQQWRALEESVFAPTQRTEILLISPLQQADYMRCYQTPAQRFHHLAPGIDRSRIAPANAKEIRQKTRHALGIPEDRNLLLFVGSGFKAKGLDRVLTGLAALPPTLREKTQLFVAGQDNAQPFLRQAVALGITSQLTFLGGRNDVPALLLAADLLVHPAYHENTGTVLLEAVVAGLPVLTVAVCGYAHYIHEAQAGVVLPAPFQQPAFNQALQDMLLSPERTAWQQHGLQFAQQADIYSMPERAVEIIEAVPAETMPFQQLMQLQGECFRAQPGRQTHRVMLDGKAYFIKQHVGVGWKEIIKNLCQFRLPIVSAKNEWRAIQRLRELSIPVPPIADYGCRGWNPARLQSFLLTEELTDTVSLEDYCQAWREVPPTFAVKQALIKEVARIASIMHAHGVNHRDFYICHFLLSLSCLVPASKPQLYLIDLHRAQIRKKVPVRWLIKDLAGLYFSSKDIGLTQRDIYRFIKYYRGLELRDIFLSELSLWQRVKKRGEKLYHKHQR